MLGFHLAISLVMKHVSLRNRFGVKFATINWRRRELSLEVSCDFPAKCLHSDRVFRSGNDSLACLLATSRLTSMKLSTMSPQDLIAPRSERGILQLKMLRSGIGSDILYQNPNVSLLALFNDRRKRRRTNAKGNVKGGFN